MKKSKKLFTFLLTVALSVLMAAGLLPVSADDIKAPEITSQNAILLHLDTGKIMYDKNSDEIVNTAFLPKIMTVILAMESVSDLNESASVNSYAIRGIDRMSDNLTAGEQVPVIDLIRCVMMASSNAACNVLADHVMGYSEDGIDAFIEKMNERAKELGAENTFFTSAHGITESGENPTDTGTQHTTVRDMAKILTHAIELEEFLNISNTSYYEITKIGAEKQPLYNDNRMTLPADEYYSSEISGIRMSNSAAFGRSLCSVSTRKMGDRMEDILCIVLFARNNEAAGMTSQDYIYRETEELYDWVFSTFKMRTLVEANKSVKEVKVNFADQRDFILLLAQDDISGFIAGEIDPSQIEYKFDIPDYLEAPISKGQIIGEVEVFYKGESFGTTKLFSSTEIYQDQFQVWIHQVNQFFSNPYVIAAAVIILLAIVFYIIYAIVYNRKKKRTSSSRIKKKFKF